VLLDGGSNVNIISKSLKKKLGSMRKLQPTPFAVRMVDQWKVQVMMGKMNSLYASKYVDKELINREVLGCSYNRIIDTQKKRKRPHVATNVHLNMPMNACQPL
jgi:hypothetical protein